MSVSGGELQCRGKRENLNKKNRYSRDLEMGREGDLSQQTERKDRLRAEKSYPPFSEDEKSEFSYILFRRIGLRKKKGRRRKSEILLGLNTRRKEGEEAGENMSPMPISPRKEGGVYS